MYTWDLTSSNLALLKTHHRIQVEVYILDNSRNYLFNMTDALVSGSVDIDVDAEATRFGKIALLDPQQRLSIDFRGAGYGSNLSNRMIQIAYRVWSMDWSQTYAAPIFTGPITDAKRDGVVINIEYKGMESVMRSGQLNAYTWPAGWARSGIIINGSIMNGIQHYADHVGAGSIINADWSVDAGDDLWQRFKDLADGGAMRIYFDGNGVLQIKPKTMAVAIGLGTDWLTEEPDYNLDISKLKNVIRVEGATVPGTDQKMVYEAWPPASHPFSPQSLARNGWPRVMPRHIRDDSLGNWSDVVWTGWNNLDWGLMAAESTTAVVPVLPFLEEWDVILINHPKLYSVSPLTKATIPLVGDAEMSLNMFTTSSTGTTEGGWGWGILPVAPVEPMTPYAGRLLTTKHGPSGAFNTLGGRGLKGGKNTPVYEMDGPPKKNKKKKNRKNKDKGKGK